jgi:hypothetical protein
LVKVAASKIRALGAGKTELYVPKGTTRISRATVFISARQFKQAKQSAEQGFSKAQSLEKLAKARTENQIDYLTRPEALQARREKRQGCAVRMTGNTGL